MLVLLIWADGMEGFHAEDADDGTENVRLFKIQVDQLRRFPLDVVDGLADMQIG
jgi:hypothetical protein